VQVIAPPVLQLVKNKGYRSGKPDTPQGGSDEGQEDLLGDGDEGDDTEEDTPEAALSRAVH
jgi:hypothetical protein